MSDVAMRSPEPSGQADVDAQRIHRALAARSREAGLFEPASALAYLPRIAGLLALWAAGFATALQPEWAVRLPALLVLAFVLVQSGMLAHDAGHGQISRRRRINAWWGHVFMSVIVGQAYGQWRTQHNAHHRATNHSQRDPDIQTDLFVLAEGQRPPSALGRWVAQHQGLLFWVLVPLQPFTIRLKSVSWVWSERASRGDRLGLVAHVGLWMLLPSVLVGPGLALSNYVVLTALTAPYLMSAFLWNHLGTATLSGDERGFAEQRLVGTRNLRSGRLYTWLFGGLNYHVEHHLLPSVPTARLPRVRTLFREICAEEGIDVPEVSWWEGMRGVAQHVRRLQRPA